MAIFDYSPENCGCAHSLYSMDPDRFQEADAELAELERRQEWPLLHGDGGIVDNIKRADVCSDAQHNPMSKEMGRAA